MDKKDQRINVTLFSTLEYKMVKALAELHGTSYSLVVAKGFSEWLKTNFIKEVERYQEEEYLLDKIERYKNQDATAPTTLAEPDLSVKEDHPTPWDIIYGDRK